MRRAVVIPPIAAMLSAIAVVCPVQAEDPLFDAGIGGYSGWPDDGSEPNGDTPRQVPYSLHF